MKYGDRKMNWNVNYGARKSTGLETSLEETACVTRRHWEKTGGKSRTLKNNKNKNENINNKNNNTKNMNKNNKNNNNLADKWFRA